MWKQWSNNIIFLTRLIKWKGGKVFGILQSHQEFGFLPGSEEAQNSDNKQVENKETFYTQWVSYVLKR